MAAVVAKVDRIFAALDTNADGVLTRDELVKAQSMSDGKISFAGLDPGEGRSVETLVVTQCACIFMYRFERSSRAGV